MFDDPTPKAPVPSSPRRLTRRAAPIIAAVAIAVAAPLATSEIIVQRGQTMSGIAKHENVTVARLAAFNGIDDPDRIYAGQLLRIPPAEGAEAQHEIAVGDTLGSIARRYRTTVDAIATRNGLTDADRIIAGRTLVIPAPGATAPTPPSAIAAPEPQPTAPPTAPSTTAPPTTAPVEPAPAPEPTVAPTTAAPATTEAPPPPTTTAAPAKSPATPARPGMVVSTIWVVQEGDTITSVAQRFDLSPNALAQANRVAVNAALTPGQYLFIPQN